MTRPDHRAGDADTGAGAGAGMTAVHTAGSEVEAVMLQGVLADAGIPVFLRSHVIPGYAAAFPPGWGDLLVPAERAADARRLLADYLASLAEEPRP
jgi:hypothetical protein